MKIKNESNFEIIRPIFEKNQPDQHRKKFILEKICVWNQNKRMNAYPYTWKKRRKEER